MKKKANLQLYNRLYYQKVRQKSKKDKQESIKEMHDALMFKVVVSVGKFYVEF